MEPRVFGELMEVSLNDDAMMMMMIMMMIMTQWWWCYQYNDIIQPTPPLPKPLKNACSKLSQSSHPWSLRACLYEAFFAEVGRPVNGFLVCSLFIKAFSQELADQLMDGPPGVRGPGAFLRTFLLLKIEIYAFMFIHFLCTPHKNHTGCEEDQDRRLITQMWNYDPPT